MGSDVASLPLEQLEQRSPAGAYEVFDDIEDVAALLRQALTHHTAQVALVTIAMQFELDGKLITSRYAQAERSARHYLSHLRVLVRKSDRVALVGFTYYFVLLGAALEGGAIVENRLWDALLWHVHNVSEGITPRPCSLAIGHSAYPFPQREVTACIAEAGQPRLTFELPRSARKTLGRQMRAPRPEQKEAELSQLARLLGVPYLSLIPQTPPAKARQLVNPRLAQELHCYPLGCERGTLTVAMSDPRNHSVLSRLQEETGLQIFPVLAPPQALQAALKQLV